MVHECALVKGYESAQMDTLGARLRLVREGLALSQAAFATLGGVAKRAQVYYEQGERVPDAAYLARIAAAGCDVLYVLTGQRSQGPPPNHSTSNDLRPEHAALIANYDALAPDDQAAIRKIIATAAQSHGITNRPRKAC